MTKFNIPVEFQVRICFCILTFTIISTIFAMFLEEKWVEEETEKQEKGRKCTHLFNQLAFQKFNLECPYLDYFFQATTTNWYLFVRPQ